MLTVIFRVWPLQLASSLRSTSCALCVETSSPAQWPYRVDTASACPVSAATGHDISPNTAPTVRECFMTGLISVSTTFWQMSQTTTGRLDHRSYLIRKWYFITFVCYHIRGDVICKLINLVYLCMFMSLLQVVDVEHMIQERLQKIERLKYSLELQKVHWKPFKII